MSSLGRAAVTKLYGELSMFTVLQNGIFVNLFLKLFIAESYLKLCLFIHAELNRGAVSALIAL